MTTPQNRPWLNTQLLNWGDAFKFIISEPDRVLVDLSYFCASNLGHRAALDQQFYSILFQRQPRFIEAVTFCSHFLQWVSRVGPDDPEVVIASERMMKWLSAFVTSSPPPNCTQIPFVVNYSDILRNIERSMAMIKVHSAILFQF